MDSLKGFGELGIGSRLKQLSDYMMKETQLVYNHFNIDFDPYLFPSFKIIATKNGITNKDIKDKLNLSQPAITQAINKLIKKELVVVKNDKTDKRKKNIILSKKGKILLEKIKPIWNSIDAVIKNYTILESKSLLEHINNMEDLFANKSFSDAIIENITLHFNNTLKIVAFKKEYSKDFYNLNIEWLKTYFYVEPYDEEVLSNPQKYIIDKGGYIFFAKLDGNIIGTVALMPMSEKKVFELTKMAVSPKHRGNKIGQQLMQYCIDFSKKEKFNKLVLYSSRKLENAIYIYRKYGFIEIPVEANCIYKRCDIKMELNF
jgi:DNA-binding MarR family transcriptional regulator/N-acetylglutamate synthase-like GNAT family acetyltransferase